MSTAAQRAAAKLRNENKPKVGIPIGKALVEYGANLPNLFTSGTEEEVLKAGATILALKKGILKIQSEHDKLVDMLEAGHFGKGKFPNVKRLRVKSDTVGRPKKEAKPNPLLDLEV